MNIKSTYVGGWMYSSLKRLKNNSNHQFAVATVYPGNEFISKQIDDITFYLLPLKGKKADHYNKHLEPFWKDIKGTIRPDVVHIHGSENPHGLSYIQSCGSDKVVVSLQGIVSVYSRYYTAGIDYKTIKKCYTLRDLIKNGGILRGQANFERRGRYEIELLQEVNHIIGRTDWDKAHTSAINPNATYHYCGETLRDPFYNHKWNYSNCQPHSIMVSQASYPIKGLHYLLKALPIILRQYPDTIIYVAGRNIQTLPFYRNTDYDKYIKKLIRTLNLNNNVIFTGPLDENQMCDRYLKSNVFVSPSSIENSPNSLGEAQLLGMPYVASFVGGVPEIVNWNQDVLYRFEEYEMLALKICKIFEAKDNFKDISDLSRYDGDKNCEDLLNIYTRILNS